MFTTNTLPYHTTHSSARFSTRHFSAKELHCLSPNIMTMAMDQQQHRHLGAIGFDHLPYSAPGPQFTNPWASSTSTAANSQLFPNSLGSNVAGFDALAKQQVARGGGSVSMPYTSIPVSAPSVAAASGYSNGPYGQELLGLPQDLMTHPRSNYEQAFSGAPSSGNTFAPTSAPTYLGSFTGLQQHQQQQQQEDDARRLSHQLVA